jgi:hypothetical protein
MMRHYALFILLTLRLAGTAAGQTGGDAVYRVGGYLNNLDHTGIFVDGQHVYEITGYWWTGGSDAVILNAWKDFLAGQDYLGAFTVPGITPEQRTAIVDTCWAMSQDPDISYTAYDALDYDSSAGAHITVSHITDVRCDGVVEYAYEANGLEVWGKANPGDSSGTPRHFDISNKSYCAEHNNLGADQPWVELSPTVQRGGSGTKWTKLRSVPKNGVREWGLYH